MTNNTSITNVISLNKFKREKNLSNSEVLKSDSTNSEAFAAPDEVRDRMDRIKHTVKKINSVMEELKKISNKEME